MLLPGADRLQAELRLAAPFSEGLVLQQGRTVPVWGSASPGARITVSFAAQTVSTIADTNGSWMALLEPLSANATAEELLASGDGEIRIPKVLVGEVLCVAGDLPLPSATSAASSSAPTFPVRFLSLHWQPTSTPQESAVWQTLPPAAGGADSISSGLAPQLARHLGAPLGLISLSSPPAPLEAWMSPHALHADPNAEAASRLHNEDLRDYPSASATYQRRLGDWLAAEKKASLKGTSSLNWFHRKNPRPFPPAGPETPRAPGCLFDRLLAPLLPFPVRGVIWAQGPGDLRLAGAGPAPLSTFITSLRDHWGEPTLPLVLVELPSITLPRDLSDRAAATLRSNQALAASDSGAALCPAVDLFIYGEKSASPAEEIARRLSLLLRATLYGQSIEYQGPQPLRLSSEHLALRITFANAESGLIAYDKPPQSFELAGADGFFHPATARIEGSSVLVTCPQVARPLKVRYAWSNTPGANLYNGAGLPASPFEKSLPP